MRVLIHGLCVLLVPIFPIMTANAQTSSLSGTVSDATGAPLPGVNVVVDDKGASTDGDGSYQIRNLKDGEHEVTASFLGFREFKQIVKIEGETTLDITLTESIESLDEVVITGVLNPAARLESSVSVSSVGLNQIQQAAPRVTAEIFRALPGIRSESTGGEGNANITVRGIPIASGGAKFLQIHEDGLPVMQFGDVAFGNADIFIRADQTLNRVEAIRGGSASTLTSNSPAGIINFISKDGKKEGGSIVQNIGVDYDNFRTDIEYGSPITPSLRFHVGGFFRQGEGPRNVGYTANLGGQVKANVTKEFDKGFVRLYFKHLNDKSISYLPMPVAVSGTNANPEWHSLDNFDIRHDATQSQYFLNNLAMGANGVATRTNVADGMNPIATSIGAEAFFNVDDKWTIEEKFRQNFHAGRFTAPFPAQLQTASSLAGEFNVVGLTYANGIQAGAMVDPSELVMRVHLFDVAINNFNNFTNDIKLSRNFGPVDLTLGFYKALQNISMTWMWNSYLMAVDRDNPALINAGPYSVNGLYAYGTPFWAGLARNYDTQYDISAPYAGVQYQVTDKLTADVSVRIDVSRARGSYAGSIQAENIDVNNDGRIDSVETSVAIVDNNNRLPVDYDLNYLSYSAGFNFLITDANSLFARYSRGGRTNADRLLFLGNILPSGDAVEGLSADMVDQAEIGVKHENSKLRAYATAFYSKISEQNWDFSAAGIRQINREYNSYGLELESQYTNNNIRLNGSVTWTKAEITKDVKNKELEGNKPRRQADFIYNLTTSYAFGATRKHSVGFTVIGTTKSFAQDNNELIMPAYAYVNPFIAFNLSKGLSASINVNNVFDAVGITEVEEGSISDVGENIVRARSITGRTTSLSISYQF